MLDEYPAGTVLMDWIIVSVFTSVDFPFTISAAASTSKLKTEI